MPNLSHNLTCRKLLFSLHHLRSALHSLLELFLPLDRYPWGNLFFVTPSSFAQHSPPKSDCICPGHLPWLLSVLVHLGFSSA
ncbi:hypothetical protein BDW66DRAFT_27435 [Aspergillus desertorum]